MNIGERIRDYRKNAGLSQKDLAKKLGVSQAMIAQYENGIRLPKIETINNIANALKVSKYKLTGEFQDIPHIGEQIRKYRTESGLSQTELANHLNVTAVLISNWENGLTQPSAERLLEICRILNISINDLYGVFPDYMNLTHEEKQHIEKYRLLDDLGREIVGYILDKEFARTKELQKKNDRIFKLESSSTTMTGSEKAGIPSRIIQYFQSVSAGTGQVIFDDAYSERITIPDIPEYRRVAYAVKVSGYSMEPLYEDGDMLLIELTCSIDVGEIGIFNVDGQAFVKKLGEGELISLNTEYGNIELTDDSRCMGRVVDIFTSETE